MLPWGEEALAGFRSFLRNTRFLIGTQLPKKLGVNSRIDSFIKAKEIVPVCIRIRHGYLHMMHSWLEALRLVERECTILSSSTNWLVGVPGVVEGSSGSAVDDECTVGVDSYGWAFIGEEGEEDIYGRACVITKKQ
jgi:hypothetical protein